MKKSLVALAALAVVGVASAQSTVTLSGIVKGGYAHTKLSGSGSGSQGAIADGSSRFIFSGTEDLGGGLKAVFQIDNRFRVDDNGGAPTSAPLGTGNTFVGLTGGWGAVKLGKFDTHYCYGGDSHGSRSTALSAASCALLGYVGGQGSSIANTSRSSNFVKYELPNFSGLTGQIAYSTAPFGTDGAPGAASDGSAWNIALEYASGPFTVGGTVWKAKGEDRNTAALRNEQDAYTIAGKWNFGFATVGLTYDRSEIDNAAIGAASIERKRSAWSIPVTVPVGPGTFLFTYTRAGDVKVNGGSQADSAANLWSVGYDYALSKRTSVGISYVALDNKANSSYQLYTQSALVGGYPAAGALAGVDQKQLYVGVRHAF